MRQIPFGATVELPDGRAIYRLNRSDTPETVARKFRTSTGVLGKMNLGHVGREHGVGAPLRLFASYGDVLFVPFGTGAANVGGNAPGQSGAGPTSYVPENWDLAAGTYTLQEGDTISQLAYFAGVQNTGSGSYVHNINVLNGASFNPDDVAAGTVIKMPTNGIANIIALGCPAGYQKAPDGKNCVKSGGGGTPPANNKITQAGMGSGWILASVAGVAALLYAAYENKKKHASHAR
jgi:hypothetical protein